MKFNGEGEIQLDDQKYKLVILLELDVVADLNTTPAEVVDGIREKFKIKKRYDGFYLDDLIMEFEVHNVENNMVVMEV